MNFDFFFRLLFFLPFFLIYRADVWPIPPSKDQKQLESKYNANILVLFSKLESIETKRLLIPEQVYRRLSRFEELFGFAFDGPKLALWLKQRLKTVNVGKAWTTAIYQGNLTITVEPDFFNLPFADQLYILVHEARHADGQKFAHIKCPKNLRQISAGQPGMDLSKYPGCDGRDDGAYAFQAAVLFELYAYGIDDQERAGLLYNSSAARIIIK